MANKKTPKERRPNILGEVYDRYSVHPRTHATGDQIVWSAASASREGDLDEYEFLFHAYTAFRAFHYSERVAQARENAFWAIRSRLKRWEEIERYDV